MNFLSKKIQSYKKLYTIYGLYWSVIILLNNFFYRIFKKRYLLSPIDFHKNYLNKKIIQLSNSKIISGHYKNTYLLNKSHWSNFDFASKLLGYYELQIQNLIVKIQKENNLTNFVNIGCGDGYHTLGLIKNKIFEQAICYEISLDGRKILEYNLKKNDIEKKVFIHKEANIHQIKSDLENLEINKTLFLIDIEGDEFKLFANEDLNFLSKSFLIIEDHNFKIKDELLKEKFYKSLKNNFNFEIINNGSRNPFNIDLDFLNKLNDDSRFLLLGEGRKRKMNWIFLSPKIN